MQTLFDALEKKKESLKKTGKEEKFELQASVNSIIAVVGLNPKYGYKYWLGVVKRSGKGYPAIQGILKNEIEKLPSQYNKGGRLTNILTGKQK